MIAYVSDAVLECVYCTYHRLKLPERDFKIITFHPRRPFELVAIDILDV